MPAFVHVKLSTSLRAAVSGYNPAQGLRAELDGPATAGELAGRLGLPLHEITLIMVNGLHGDFDTPLRDGDRVAYFPPVGGG